MISRIESLKYFGVYNDYSPKDDIQNFAEKNIIYGWNYSGKTMLSRLFGCLENQALHPDFPEAQFRIADQEEQKITESNLDTSEMTVRVFNSEFTSKNLSWDGEAFNPILLLGEDSIDAKKKIASNTLLFQRCLDSGSKKNSKIESIDSEIASKKTAKAKQIRQNLALVETFTATHVNSLISEVEGNPKTFILKQELVSSSLKKALASDDEKLDLLSTIQIKLGLEKFGESVEPVLKKTPELSNTLDYLEEDSELSSWIDHGLKIHEDKSRCEFCGNKLNEERILEFKAHFSEDLRNFKSAIEKKLTEAEKLKIEMSLFHKNDFYPEFQIGLIKDQDQLSLALEAYNKNLFEISKVLKRKFDSPFSPISLKLDFAETQESLANSISKINQLIVINNEATNSFGSEKIDAINKLKRHYVAELYIEIPLPQKQHQKNILNRHIKWFDVKKVELEKENSELEAKISLAQKGRLEINRYITGLLGRDEIQIEVIKHDKEERFRLVRDGKVARNLSEGEKTAISFSFFITKLLELGDLSDAIIYIDDPISSLDSNHIFQVNAILKDVFCHQDSPGNSEWKLRCKQLFVSTHNFEFFTLLRELPPKKLNKSHFYFVKRTGKNESTLIDLPNSIAKYSSEYHYLFSVIYEFHNSDNKENLEVLFAIPNALRRFLELYTYAKIPTRYDTTVDQRAGKLFGAKKSKRILKVLHYFSHLNSIERISKNSDLMSDIENVVNDVMVHLEQDSLHYDALIASL